MTNHVKKPASAEDQPEPTTKTVERGSHPALIALVRLLAWQVAAELINGTSPVDEPGSLTNPPTAPHEATFPAPKDNSP